VQTSRQMKLEDYDGFVEKFKPKKTTDDCMTPPTIYEIVKDYVCQRWNVDPEKIVRPFWPGGDYEAFDYPDDAVVVDNPPFSILAAIKRFYLQNQIQFFLFAPSLTIFSGGDTKDVNHIICDCSIVYENGAEIKTSFVTSFGLPNILESSPELTERINAESKKLRRQKVKELPKYSYPYEVVTAAMVQKYSQYGIAYAVQRDECAFIRELDAQAAAGKSIFGGALLLSERAAAERAAAERAVAERTAVERAAAKRAVATRWELSERERYAVAVLSRKTERKPKEPTEG